MTTQMDSQMTFPAKLERLLKQATMGPWIVDSDDRPGMYWNNHIVVDGLPWTVCFMTHDPLENSGQQAAAELICFLRNNAEHLVWLAQASGDLMRLYKNSVDVGPHDNPRTEAAICRRINGALAALNAGKQGDKT